MTPPITTRCAPGLLSRACRCALQVLMFCGALSVVSLLAACRHDLLGPAYEFAAPRVATLWQSAR
ncbi:MAG: hypothetical protein V3S11_02905 [Elusimicrobiota bacterium]